jgi:hypothetical protein
MKKLWNAFKIFAPVTPFIFLKNNTAQSSEQDDSE